MNFLPTKLSFIGPKYTTYCRDRALPCPKNAVAWLAVLGRGNAPPLQFGSTINYRLAFYGRDDVGIVPYNQKLSFPQFPQHFTIANSSAELTWHYIFIFFFIFFFILWRHFVNSIGYNLFSKVAFWALSWALSKIGFAIWKTVAAQGFLELSRGSFWLLAQVDEIRKI